MMPPSDQECLLFRLPIEIRNEIYRYLLLPASCRYMGLDKTDPGHFIEKIRDHFPCDNWETDFGFDGEDQPTHLEILRANKQIHDEAAAILYKELTILIEPGDIVCLTKIPDIEPANKRVWRHNPLHCVRSRTNRESFSYIQQELDGRMEPHVFARFEKIKLMLSFDWTMGQIELSMDSEYNINKAEVVEFMTGLQKSTFLKDFVQILSNSYHVRHLSISMGFEVMAFWDDEDEETDFDLDYDDEDEEVDDDLDYDELETFLLSQGSELSDDPHYPQLLESLHGIDDTYGSDDDSTRSESTVESDDIERGERINAQRPDPVIDAAEDKERTRGVKANEKSMDMFLESGILEPLRKLNNVDTVTIDFNPMMGLDSGRGYVPQPNHAKMLQELKSEIEGNYKRSQVANGSVASKRMAAEVVENSQNKASKIKKMRIA